MELYIMVRSGRNTTRYKREGSRPYDQGNPNDGSREKLWKVKKTSALPANPTRFGDIGFLAYARGNGEGSKSCGGVGRQSGMSVSMGAFCHADGNQSIDTAWSAWSGQLVQEMNDLFSLSPIQSAKLIISCRPWWTVLRCPSD